jgi:ABC-2 type transport system ATP-binding protein
VNGHEYKAFPAPLHEVGAMLEARAIHTGRSASNHLLALAQTHGIGRRRVQEMIELVGLADVAGKRAGGFSLGMGQRLGIAAALLGDPGTLILDEPANGLDPEGILWIRNLLRRLAAEGRTVFLSSHLMAEISQTAEHLIVIGRGRLIADTSVRDILAEASEGGAVMVRTPQSEELQEALAAKHATVRSPERGLLEVHGLTSAEVGTAAAQEGIVLHELIPQKASLEDVFMRLTGDAVDYHALVGEPQEEVPA